MKQSTVQDHIAAGFAKAASIVGAAETLYRPSAANDPIAAAPLTTLHCLWDVTPAFGVRRTAQPGHAYASLLADPRRLLEGDYLVGDDIHFVARVEPLRAALCVLCNETIDFLSNDVVTTAGTNSYGGHVAANDVVVAAAWPVSMSARARGGRDTTKLPSDTKSVYYDVLAPPIPGVTLTFGMRARDPRMQHYEIVSAEFSDFGWKLVVGLATT